MPPTRRMTISIFTENVVGMLHRVTSCFTRRKLNIDSITASESEVPGIYRYTILVTAPRATVEKVVAQLDRQVDVVKAFVHEEDQVVLQEIALYKVPTGQPGGAAALEALVRQEHARVLAVDPEFVVLEKTGHPEETRALYERLRPWGILEFASSGPVAVTRPMQSLADHLAALEGRFRHHQGEDE